MAGILGMLYFTPLVASPTHSMEPNILVPWPFPCRYVEEHIQRTGVAIETQGFTFITSGRKRESLTVRNSHPICSAPRESGCPYSGILWTKNLRNSCCSKTRACQIQHFITYKQVPKESSEASKDGNTCSLFFTPRRHLKKKKLFSVFGYSGSQPLKAPLLCGFV